MKEIHGGCSSHGIFGIIVLNTTEGIFKFYLNFCPELFQCLQGLMTYSELCNDTLMRLYNTALLRLNSKLLTTNGKNGCHSTLCATPDLKELSHDFCLSHDF